MRQRILLSPCLCSALVNRSPHCCFLSLSFSGFIIPLIIVIKEKAKTDYTRVQEFASEEGEVGETFSFCQLEDEKWLKSKTVTPFCSGEFFMLQLSFMDGDYSSLM